MSRTCVSYPLSMIATKGDASPASGTHCCVLGFGNTQQTFLGLLEGIVPGTRLDCQPLPFSAPNTNSESVVGVCLDITEEGSCMVSGTNGSPVVGGPSVETRTMQDSWMNDGLVAGGPPVCTNLSYSGLVGLELHGSEGNRGYLRQ